MSGFRLIVVVVTMCLLLVGAAVSQVTTATFYGIVTDPTGAVIPGATVTLTNAGTGAAQSHTTDTAGEFAFTFVRVGTYTVRIQADGFKAFEGQQM